MGVNERNLTGPDIMSKISGGRAETRRWPDQGGPIVQAVAMMREEHEDRLLMRAKPIGPHADSQSNRVENGRSASMRAALATEPAPTRASDTSSSH